MQFSWIIFGNLILLGNYYFLTSPNLLLKSFMQYSFIIFHLLCIYDATFKIPAVFWEFLITLLFLFKKSVRFMSFPISPFNWRLDLYLNLRESNIFLLLHFLLWSLLSKLPSFTSEAPALSPKFLHAFHIFEILCCALRYYFCLLSWATTLSLGGNQQFQQLIYWNA